MTWSEFLLRHQRVILNLVSGGLFLLCSVGLCGLSYECIKKYMENPQGVDLSYRSQHQIEFPSLNFCPVGTFTIKSRPQPLKEEFLRECGLKMQDMTENFIGNGTKQCEDPNIFWERASLDLKDLGIKSISIKYFDGNIVHIPIDEKK